MQRIIRPLTPFFFLIALLSITSIPILGSIPKDRLILSENSGTFGMPAPYLTKKGPGIAYISLLFDTLVWKDKNGEIIPLLATSWKYNGKKNAWHFILNKNARWHDLNPVTADDAVFTFQYVKKHLYPYTNTRMIKRVEKIDAFQFTIYLNEKFVPFITEVAGTLPILPKHIYEKIDTPKKFIAQKACIGSGPYQLSLFNSAKKECLLKKTKGYYLGEPLYNEVAIIKMPPATAVEALLKGRIDMVRSVPSQFLEKLGKRGVKTVSTQSGHPLRLLFNHGKDPFQNRDIRHAIAFAINRQELIDIGMDGGGEIENTGGISFVNPWHAKNLPDYAVDTKQSSELLLKNGYQKNTEGFFNKKGKALKFEIITEKRFERIGTLIVQQLKKSGINPTLLVVNKSVLDAKMDQFSFDAALFMSSALGDPVSYARRVSADVPYSDRFTENATLSRLLVENIKVLDITQRKEMIAKAQEIFAFELPSYYLFMPIWSTAFNTKITPFYTRGGILHGIPLPLNKLIFIQDTAR